MFADGGEGPGWNPPGGGIDEGANRALHPGGAAPWILPPGGENPRMVIVPAQVVTIGSQYSESFGSETPDMDRAAQDAQILNDQATISRERESLGIANALIARWGQSTGALQQRIVATRTEQARRHIGVIRSLDARIADMSPRIDLSDERPDGWPWRSDP